MSLRARVIAAVTLIAVTLVVVLVFVTRTTEANLIAQVDDQLAKAVQPVRDVVLGTGASPGSAYGPDSRPEPPPDGGGRGAPELSSVYVGLVDGDQVITAVTPDLRGEELALPALDATETSAAAVDGEPFNAAAEDSDLRWRVQAFQGPDGVVTAIGLPLDTVDATVGDLITLEVIGAAVILVALALVAFWVIRLGVMPVQQMTHTATAIAAGDLAQRVPDTNPSTEAGELGDALNQMLGSIEGSFAERDRAEARLRQFVADASHELRTPVATIRGYAELYRSGGLSNPDRLDDAMRRTEAESIRMGGLVEDLLSLARLDEGRPLEFAAVDLSLIAHDAATDAHAVDPDRPIEADAASPVIVRVDDARIRQVVANLVGNAMVHTPAGTPITITSGIADGVPYIEVADRGPGMPAEVSARAFERFYRADPSRSRHAGGSGLGLAIVEATVRAHGGQVALKSTPGDGTAVRIELPSPQQS